MASRLIFELVLLGLVYSHLVHSQACNKDRATKLWIAKSFIQHYLSLDIGDHNKIIAGEKAYKVLKLFAYKEQKVSGTLFDVPRQRLIDKIDDWRRQRLLSDDDVQEQWLALDSTQSDQLIKEALFNRSQLEMVYGLTGYLRLNGKYASVWTFYSFKLDIQEYFSTSWRPLWSPRARFPIYFELRRFPNFSWDRLWGGGLNQYMANHLDNVMSYVRHEALQNFNKQNKDSLTDLLDEETRCSDFLPAAVKNVNRKINYYTYG